MMKKQCIIAKIALHYRQCSNRSFKRDRGKATGESIEHVPQWRKRRTIELVSSAIAYY